MARGWKIVLGLVLFSLIALATLPGWLGAALRPILRAQGITFDRYERDGYARFKLTGARYERPGLVITAAEVHADTPLLWLERRMRGGDSVISVDHWVLRYLPNSNPTAGPRVVTGLADLQRLLVRLAPTLHRWLPLAQLQAGELRGFTPEMTLARAEWRDSKLTVDGLHLAGRDWSVAIGAQPDASFSITVDALEKDLRTTVQWSAEEIKGTGTWWEQPLALTAAYEAHGWLPATANVTAEHWQLPAARVKLGAPYEMVRGDARASWRDGAFDLTMEATAEPGTGTKAPRFEAKAAAHGTLREFTLASLHLDAPFASATLTAPITFGFDHPLAASAAELIVKADLSKLPWFDAHGTAEGRVTVSGNATHARQVFALDFNGVSFRDVALEKAHVRGTLVWPELSVEQCDVTLDRTSSASLQGVLDLEQHTFARVTLEAKAGPSWFTRWLPANTTWAAGEISAKVSGPFDAAVHQGTLKFTGVKVRPLQPVAVDAEWTGTGTSVEILAARLGAGASKIELAGQLDAGGLLLRTFVLAPRGQPVWQLESPSRLAWSPSWQADGLTLAGPASRLTLKGHGGPDGSLELDSTGFDSDWLQDWIAVTGPHWTARTVQVRGHLDDGMLAFDAAVTAEIAMEPQPAEVKFVAAGDSQGIVLKELTVASAGRMLTQASGKLPWSWRVQPEIQLITDEKAPFELTASTDPDSPLWAVLAAYTGLKLERAEAKVALKGTLHDPAGEVQGHAARLGFSEGRFKFSLPEFEDLSLSLAAGRKEVKVTTFAAKLDGQTVQASGHLPMDDAHWQQLWHTPAAFDWSETTASVEIPDADLAVLSRHLPNLIAPKGRLRAKVELAPGGKLSGELHLADVSSRPLPPFSTLQEINADLVLSDRTLTVRNLTGKIGGEPVAIDGTVTFVPGGSPRLALGLKGRNLPLVRNTGLLIRNDVDLHALTDAAGVTRVTGTVTLRDCLVLANLGALLPTGQRGVTRQPPYFAVEADPFRSWTLSVEVRGPQAIRLRTTVFNGTASARFQLGGTLGEPRAVGELTVDQGQVLFPFAAFVVQQGTVRLREADPFHATVNLNATSQRRDYQLRLEVTGNLPSPVVALSSTPALEAEAALLMVMTGQPPNNEATTSSGGQRLALLGAYLGRGVFQDLGIGGEERLEISSGEQVSVQGRETYDFEYKLDSRWSLTGEYDRFDAYNAGLKWRVYTQESKPVEKK